MSRHGFHGIALLCAVTAAVLCAPGPAAQDPGARARSLMVLDARPIEVQFERMDWPVFSPSGDTIAFSALAPDGRRHIFTIPANGGAPRAITSGAGDDWTPRYSPDGRRVAFVSNRSGNRDLWVVPAEGGEPAAVTSDPADDLDPDWSPDGKRLVFASNRGGPTLIYQLMLDTKQVFALSDGSGEDRRPAWSPDGQTIAFQSSRGGKRHVYLIPADGGEATRVGRDESREESWPAWMPDGSALICQVGMKGNPSRLYLYPLAANLPPTIISVPPVPGRPEQLGAPPPSLSRDGTRLVMASGGEASLQIIKLAGGASVVLTSRARLRHPSWAKDGRRLVMSGDLSGTWDLWIVGAASGKVTRLTDDDDLEIDPVWSRQTGDVLYVLEAAGGNLLKLLEPETQRAIVVGGGENGSEPAWSPDGLSIAYVSAREGSRDIWIRPVGGGSPRRLTLEPGSETHPTWSPDGAWIAYASDQGKGSSIWKVPSAGGTAAQLTQLSEKFTGDTQPDWSPSNRHIAFTRALASGGSDVYMMTPEGQEHFPIGRGLGKRLMDPAWSPDGGHLAITSSSEDQIVVLTLGEPPSQAPPAPRPARPPPPPPQPPPGEGAVPEEPGEDEDPGY
ncbi:MAG: DPP IV N-terminal domain-containing protein [Candidatus Polarisedimenticolia bacterium]